MTDWSQEGLFGREIPLAPTPSTDSADVSKLQAEIDKLTAQLTRVQTERDTWIERHATVLREASKFEGAALDLRLRSEAAEAKVAALVRRFQWQEDYLGGRYCVCGVYERDVPEDGHGSDCPFLDLPAAAQRLLAAEKVCEALSESLQNDERTWASQKTWDAQDEWLRLR